jgi:hypothetical protein
VQPPIRAQQLFDALASKAPRNNKSGGCAQKVTAQHKGKSPPEAKEKATPDAEYTARQKQQIANRVRERVDQAAPHADVFN